MNSLTLDYSWTWRTVAVSAVFTLGIFLLLPFLEMLSSTQGERMVLYNADTVPPPPPPEPPEPKPKASHRKLPKPKLAELRERLIPLNAILNLNLALGDVSGDFDLNFNVLPGDLLKNTGVFELGDLDNAPKPLIQLRPIYPPAARARKIEGEVKLEFVINSDGAVSHVTVISAHPSIIFDDSAIRAAQRWRFEPGTKDGKAVPVRVRQKLVFRLEG